MILGDLKNHPNYDHEYYCSHLNEEKVVKSSKKEKQKEKRKKNNDSDLSAEKAINTGRITPSGTNVPRSQKKRKKRKRK